MRGIRRSPEAAVKGRVQLPADNKLLDTLAAFGAESEDRENDLSGEENGDRDDDGNNDNAFDGYANAFGQTVVPVGDNEPDCPEARQRFIKEQQLPDPGPSLNSRWGRFGRSAVAQTRWGPLQRGQGLG